VKVHELIATLRDVDPDDESDVEIYICRRYGGYRRVPTKIRRFIENGAVMITDECDGD